MVPKEFRRPLCIAAGWITLLEAVVWGAVSIYGIGVYNCTWEFLDLQNGISTWSMLYVTYFMGKCKGDISAVNLGYLISPPVAPASNLQVWLWIYAIVSVAWVPACILLIIAATVEIRGRVAAMIYYPWVSLSVTLVCLDLAGTIFHLVDVFNTLTPDDYGSFTNNKSWYTLTNNAPTDGITSWLPSLFMTIFFCRFLLLWILNIFLVYGVFKASNAVSLYKTKSLQVGKSYDAPDSNTFEEPPRNTVTNTQVNKTEETHPRNPVTPLQDPPWSSMTSDASVARYRVDEYGIPIEELDSAEPKGSNVSRQSSVLFNTEDTSRSPYQPSGNVFDFTGRPIRPESFSDSAPPIASGVHVPPELNKFEPFSYMAGDQPQLMRRPVTRSTSSAEYPPIPRPDYTVADRRSPSLEYVPNRFKVPAPKRPTQSQSSFARDSSGPRSPISPKVAPIPPRKPQAYPRSTPSIPEDPGLSPQTSYIPQQAVPNMQQSYYTRQSSQTNNYNINRLY